MVSTMASITAMIMRNNVTVQQKGGLLRNNKLPLIMQKHNTDLCVCCEGC